MLRITVQEGETATTMRLEGKLAGPEVKELTTCWLAAVASDPHKSIVVDMEGVTFIDGEGKKLLAEMQRRGVQFVAPGRETPGLVEDIEGGR